MTESQKTLLAITGTVLALVVLSKIWSKAPQPWGYKNKVLTPL